jgi:hypothetical protein
MWSTVLSAGRHVERRSLLRWNRILGLASFVVNPLRPSTEYVNISGISSSLVVNDVSGGVLFILHSERL